MDPATSNFVRYRERGRPADLARVFDAVAQELLLVASHLAAPGVQPEDLLQATFLRAIEDADSFDSRRPIRPWLIGILTNQARSAGRRARRRPDPSRLPSADSSQDPSAVVEDAEFAEAVHRAIQTLSDPYRETLTLRFVHGLSPTQIAHALGHPPGTVKSWIHRGVERLRTLLPAGFAASLATMLRAGEQLVDVRAEVLRAASVRAPHVWGAVAWLAVAASLVVGAAAWLWWPSGPQPTLDAGGAATFSTEAAVGAAPPASPQPTDRAPEAPPPGLHIRTLTADASPLAAGVYLRPRWGADPELRARWVATDDAGRAHVDDLEPGDWDVELDRGEGAAVASLTRGRAVRLELRAPDVPALEGRVVLPDGQPVAAAELWLTRQGSLSEGYPIGRSDARGRFVLVGVPSGRALSAQKPGYMVGGMFGVPAVGARNGTETWTIAIRTRAARVRGIVVDTAGRALEGARVMLGSPPAPDWDLEFCAGLRLRPPVTLWTDAEGRFDATMAAPNRATSLWVRAAGFAPLRVGIQVPDEGEVHEVRAVLREGATCLGVARDASGTLVPGLRARADSAATVHRPVLDQAPEWLAPTSIGDGDGQFELQGLTPGWVRLRASDPGSGRWAVRVDDVDGARLRWEPVLARGLAMAGRLRTVDGHGLAGWRVAVEGVAAERKVARTDPRGGFALEGLEDRTYTVVVLPPEPAADRQPEPTPGELDQPAVALVRPGVHPRETLDLRVVPGSMPRWFVRAFLAGASPSVRWASLTRIDGGRYHAPIGEDGRIEIGPLPAGRYYLSLEGDDALELLHGPFAVGPDAGGDVDLGALNVEPPGRVQVRLRTLGAVPPDMVQVSIGTPDAAMIATVLALTDGVGTSWNVPAGDYVVWLEDPRLGSVQRPVRVSSGSMAEVELVEEASEPVVIHWDHPVFDGMRRVRVAVEDQHGAVRWYGFGARSSPSTPLRVGMRLPAGRYHMHAHSGLAPAATASFEVVAHMPTPVIELHH